MMMCWIWMTNSIDTHTMPWTDYQLADSFSSSMCGKLDGQHQHDNGCNEQAKRHAPCFDFLCFGFRGSEFKISRIGGCAAMLRGVIIPRFREYLFRHSHFERLKGTKGISTTHGGGISALPFVWAWSCCKQQQTRDEEHPK